MNTSTLRSELQKSGYFNMLYGRQLAQDIEDLSRLWKEFCKQSYSAKYRHVYTTSGGYEHKEETDYKENFHLSLVYQPPPMLSSIEARFIDAGKKFIEASAPTVYAVAEVMGEQGNFDCVSMVRESLPFWSLRFLHYYPRTMKQIMEEMTTLAEEHVDYFLTIHWFEDAPGLYVYWKGEWVEVSALPGGLTAYPGLNLQYYSRGRLTGLCHRVHSTPLTEVNGRYAIVAFIRLGDVIFNKELYGSTQKFFPNGKNYGMGHRKFSKLFIPMNALKETRTAVV